MAIKWFNGGIENILNGVIGNLESANIDWLLLTSGYTFDADDYYVDDLTPGSNELSGGNYARIDISSSVVAVDDANDGAYWDAADPTFPSLQAAAGTPTSLVAFLNVGPDNDATSILICCLTLPGTAPNGNNYVCELVAPPAGIGYWRNVAGEGLVYNTGIEAIMQNDVDLLTDALILTLHTSSYTPSAEHDTYANLTNELSGGGYSEQPVGAGQAVDADDANDGAYFDFTDEVFPSLEAGAGTPAYASLHSQTDSDQLICCNSLDTPGTPDGNNYEINNDAPPAGFLWVRNSSS